jgi:hypothetical protein
MERIKHILFVTLIFILDMSACNTQPRQVEPTLAATQFPVATQTTESVATRAQANLPRTDAEVPRVPVDQAKAAFDSGEAVIVDVRGFDAYARSHIAGALEVSLSEIQTNPTGLNLDKNKWIITYCT